MLKLHNELSVTDSDHVTELVILRSYLSYKGCQLENLYAMNKKACLEQVHLVKWVCQGPKG